MHISKTLFNLDSVQFVRATLHESVNILMKNVMALSSYSMSNVVKLRKTALTGRTSSSRERRQILSNLGLFCSQDMFTWT